MEVKISTSSNNFLNDEDFNLEVTKSNCNELEPEYCKVCGNAMYPFDFIKNKGVCKECKNK